MPSRKKPVLPGFAPRTTYSDAGQAICSTPGSRPITRSGSPPVPGAWRASAAETATCWISGRVARTVVW